MNENTIDDLKQFISAVISQQTSDIRVDLTDLQKNFNKMDKKIDDLSQAVAEALDISNETIESRLKDHEQRLSQLEHKVA